jgi:hypothetical protein
MFAREFGESKEKVRNLISSAYLEALGRSFPQSGIKPLSTRLSKQRVVVSGQRG